MNKNKILSTGKFARLCKTTKETLFHYDRENLLKPKYVFDNGYRGYGLEQYYDFDMISVLKETGSSLKEIKAYFQDMNRGDILTLLEAKRLVVRQERKRLAQREMMLEDMAALTREALSFDYDTFTVLAQDEERLEVVPTEAALIDSASEFVTQLAEYGNFYAKLKRIPRYPFGMIINQQDALQGKYRERYFFGRATRSTPRSHLHVKPKGRYAIVAHKGTMQTHLDVFTEFLRLINNADLTVAGNVYVYDMMSYLLQGGGERYAVKYCVLVK